MGRARSTPRSFGLIPRTPPGIKTIPAPSETLDAGRPLAPVLRTHELTAGIASSIAVGVFVGAEVSGRTDPLWFPFALFFALLLGLGNRAGRAVPLEVPAGSVESIRMESELKTVARAALVPVVIAVGGIAASVAAGDHVYESFVIGVAAGHAIIHWRSAHRFRALEATLGAPLVGYLPWRLSPWGVDGAVWVRRSAPAAA